MGQNPEEMQRLRPRVYGGTRALDEDLRWWNAETGDREVARKVCGDSEKIEEDNDRAKNKKRNAWKGIKREKEAKRESVSERERERERLRRHNVNMEYHHA